MKEIKLTALRVTGYRKKCDSKPCEDGVKVSAITPYGAVLAVADGHGDPKCVYAADGARIAAQIAVKTLSAFAGGLRRRNPSVYFAENRDAIALELALGFRHAVIEDYAKKHPTAPPAPLSELHEVIEEVAFAPIGRIVGREDEAHKKRRALSEWLDAAALCYGTTLRASLLGEKYIFSLGVGDGDTLAVFEDGEVSWLLPKGEAYDTSTHSMCYPTSELLSCISFALLPLKTEADEEDAYRVRSLVLSTDGLRNSFTADAHFLDFARRLTPTDKNGERSLRRRLEALTRNSVYGDDITLAAAFIR